MVQSPEMASLRSLASVLALALCSTASAQDEATQEVQLRPFVHCVETLPGSKLRAHWGYFNRTKTSLQRVLGADNRVTGQAEGEPPTQFQPGFVMQAFSSVFDAASTSTWTLAGVSATANKHAHACSPAERAASPTQLINPAPGSAMFLGANFWSLHWQPVAEYFLPQANFAAERPAAWTPRF